MKLDLEIEIVVLGGSKIGLVELFFVLLNLGDIMILFDFGYLDYLFGIMLV